MTFKQRMCHLDFKVAHYLVEPQVDVHERIKFVNLHCWFYASCCVHVEIQKPSRYDIVISCITYTKNNNLNIISFKIA